MTKTIKAPFNFVPFNKNVFYPDWGNKISQDIPFSDGESGEIDLEMIAKTPVFVRNGHTPDDALGKNKKYTSFSNDGEGSYFIPATSVKGMIRNVLEIISYGKMKFDKNMLIAQREWNNTEIYTLKDPAIQNTIHCGWLELKEHEDSVLQDCGFPLRINHIRIDEYLNSKENNLLFRNFFSEKSNLNIEKTLNGKKYDPKDATFKYALLNNNFSLLENLHFEKDEDYSSASKTRFKVSVSDREENTKGTIVFTGQPGPWKNREIGEKGKGSGKFYEFIFPDDIDGEYKISNKKIEQFKFIYKDSPSWNLYKSRKKIPVFFRTDKEGIKDFGLALLYKLPYNQSVEDIIEKYQKPTNNPDLSECIFGYANKNDSLKSRVQFSHFYVEKDVIPEKEEKTTLGSPKASYYPIYIKQSGKDGITNKYNTFNDEDAEISGWKRYPIKNNAKPQPSDNIKLDVPFSPLPSETKFKGKIKFHNLKPIEIGALLSAITFHGNQDKLFHNIGMGKPLGYGKIKINLQNIIIDGESKKIEPFLISFEKELDKYSTSEFNTYWAKSSVICELFSMAEGSVPNEDELLKYMKMDPKLKDEYTIAKGGKNGKGEKEYLRRFTELTCKHFSFNSPYEDIREEEENNRKAAAEKAKSEAEAKAEAEAEAESAAKSAEAKAAKEEKLKNEKQEGLIFLKDKVKNFNQANNRIDRWMQRQKIEILPEKEHKILYEALLRLYNGEKKNKKKRWELPFSDSSIWKIVADKWVGEEIAREWYQKIIKKQ